MKSIFSTPALSGLIDCFLNIWASNVSINYLNHTFYKTNFKLKFFTADVKCNGTIEKGPFFF